MLAQSILSLLFFLLCHSLCHSLPRQTSAPSSLPIYAEMPWEALTSLDPQITGEALTESTFMPSVTPMPGSSPMPMMSPMVSPIMGSMMSPMMSPMMSAMSPLTNPMITTTPSMMSASPTHTTENMGLIRQPMKEDVHRDIGPMPLKEWIEAKRRAWKVGPKLMQPHQ